MDVNLLQAYLDRLVPKRTFRWTLAGFLALLFFLKIILIKSHYLIAYCASLYLLHGAIGFLTPKDDEIPDIFEDLDFELDVPANIDNEFKPFIRKMPEFQLWIFIVKILAISILLSCFDVFDIPVFVPILVIYFILITSLTLKNLLIHMKKFNYNPFVDYKIKSKD